MDIFFKYFYAILTLIFSICFLFAPILYIYSVFTQNIIIGFWETIGVMAISAVMIMLISEKDK